MFGFLKRGQRSQKDPEPEPVHEMGTVAPEPAPSHYRFYLQRDADVSGKSGTGRVADGVLWTNGKVTIQWRGEHSSIVNWDQLYSAIEIHGHDGLTHIVWIDDAGWRD